MGIFPTSRREYAGNYPTSSSSKGFQVDFGPILLLLLGFAASIGIAPASHAQANAPSLQDWLAGQLTLAAGLDYSRGDYGQETDTEVLYVPFTIRYLFDEFAPTPTRRDQLEFGLSVPYVEVDGPFGTGARQTSREQGIGDIQLGISYLYYPERLALPASEWSFQAKLPTADESRGLGTGKADFALQLTLFQRYGDFVLFASGGYRFIGKNPPDYILRNGATAGVGLSWIPLEGWSLGASYDWRQAIAKTLPTDAVTRDALVTADDGHELVFFGSIPLGAWLKASPYGVVGLSDGSPNFALGAQLQLSIPIRPGEPAP